MTNPPVSTTPENYFVLNDVIYLTPEQVCQRKNGSPTVQTLANLRSKCEGLPFIRIRRRIFYSLKDVMAWEKRQQKRTRKKSN